MSAITRWSLLLSGLLVASMAHADALSDLRTKLAGLNGSTPYKGSLTMRSTVTNGKKAPTHAQVAMDVASDAAGLHMGFAPALLARASGEAAAQAKNPDAPTPTVDALAKLSPDRVQGVLDMGPVLLHLLEGATLTSESNETRDGKPAHLLVVAVPSGVGADERDAVKHYEGTLKLWLGADGIPVALAAHREYQGRKFLISFSFGNDLTATLAQVGTRLVATSRRAENTNSGFGQTGSSVTETTLTAAH